MKKITIILYLILLGCTQKDFAKEYYEDGSIKAKYQINEDGLFNGLFKGYNQEGSLILEINYKNGKREGMTKSYRENGNLYWKGEFENDKENGILKFYYEDGNLSSKQSYKNGKRHGISKFYYENGDLEVLGNYKKGKEHKSFYVFNEDEYLERINIYEYGEQLSWLEIGGEDKEKLGSYPWIKVAPREQEKLYIREGIEISIEKHGASEEIDEIQVTSICVNGKPSSQNQEILNFDKDIAEYHFKPNKLNAEAGQKCILRFTVFSNSEDIWEMISHEIEYILKEEQDYVP